MSCNFIRLWESLVCTLSLGASPSERPKLRRPLLTMLAMKLLCSMSICVSRAKPSQRMHWNVCKKKLSEDGPQRICHSEQNSWFPPLSLVTGALGKANLKQGDDEGAVEALLSSLLNINKPEDFIKAFVAATTAAEKVPVMIVDEANIAFPNGNGGNGNGRRESAYRALATFVALTKEQRKASVILVASDYAFPLGLQALGFNKYDALNTIVAPEVEEKPMLSVLQEWGLSSRLGTGAMSNFAQCFSKALLLLAHAHAKQGRNLVFFVLLNFL